MFPYAAERLRVAPCGKALDSAGTVPGWSNDRPGTAFGYGVAVDDAPSRPPRRRAPPEYGTYLALGKSPPTLLPVDLPAS